MRFADVTRNSWRDAARKTGAVGHVWHYDGIARRMACADCLVELRDEELYNSAVVDVLATALSKIGPCQVWQVRERILRAVAPDCPRQKQSFADFIDELEELENRRFDSRLGR